MPDSCLFPLSEFYTHAKLPMPAIEVIPGDVVPEPYRTLLVHHNDMTPTLETHYNSRIHLEILSRERRGDFYFREVLLRLDGDDCAVEFGANKVYIGRFADDARDMIEAEELPLGRILRECHVAHNTEAKGFLRVQADALIAEKLGVPAGTILYGRKAVISDPQHRPLSEIVEILPPAPGPRL
ncbi:MAG TPA: hypothetical protein PKA41_00755 [Verrucomicrobiota bacterium]|nr:hypothetical protein [Verrucomicrobiota bacterium]